MSQMFDRRYFEDYDGLGRRGDDSCARPLLTLLRRRVPTGRLKVIGCGYGRFLREAERTYETYGIDISEHAINRAQKEASRSTLGVVDIESRRAVQEFVGELRFDVIVAINVLEHLKSPYHVIEHAHELLRDGGHFFFKVPRGDSLIRRWYSFRGREHEWQALKDKTHVSLLPREEWTSYLDAMGFTYMELPTIPTGKMKRWFSSIDALHRFYFLPRLPFVSHVNEGLTVLGWKGQS